MIPDDELARMAAASRAALSAVDGKPAPAHLACAPGGGLLAWASKPISGPSPLPSPYARRSRRGGAPGGWSMGLLPAENLAVDLAARGLTYAPGLGYVVDGERVTTNQAARMVAEVLDDAAARLPDPRLSVLHEGATLLGDESRAARLQACDDDARGEIPGDLGVVAWAMALDTSGPMRAAHRAALAEPPTEADVVEDTPLVRAERAVMRDALSTTGDEIRTSAAARRAALDLVREHLDEPPALERPEEGVEAFLARFDGERTVRRAALWADYCAAGSPGDRRKSAVFAAAAMRWGDPVRGNGGHYVFRPARAETRS